MRKFVAALAFAAALASGAAFADTIENAYGNTITVTYPSGAVARYHFNADATFSATGPDGSVMGGSYRKNGDQLCLTPTGGAEGCVPYVGDKAVGDTWTQTGTDGGVINVALVAGR
jgi:opacity protein-like surface antigen